MQNLETYIKTVRELNLDDTVMTSDGILNWFNELDISNGKSAYEIAVEHGFKGSEEEWIKSYTNKFKIEQSSNKYTVFAKAEKSNDGTRNATLIFSGAGGRLTNDMPEDTYLISLNARNSLDNRRMVVTSLENSCLDHIRFGYYMDDKFVYFLFEDTDVKNSGNREFTILNNNEFELGEIDSFNDGKEITFVDVREYQIKDSNIVNVKDFGVKGDGITDDTSMFQSVVNSIQEHQTIYVPFGTYILKNTINITKPINLIGDGILSAGTTALSININPDDYKGQDEYRKDGSIKDITIIANNCGLHIHHANGFVIDNCKLYNAVSALIIDSENEIYVDNTKIRNFIYTGQCGIEINTTDSSFSNTVIQGYKYGIINNGGNNRYNSVHGWTFVDNETANEYNLLLSSTFLTNKSGPIDINHCVADGYMYCISSVNPYQPITIDGLNVICPGALSNYYDNITIFTYPNEEYSDSLYKIYGLRKMSGYPSNRINFSNLPYAPLIPGYYENNIKNNFINEPNSTNIQAFQLGSFNNKKYNIFAKSLSVSTSTADQATLLLTSAGGRYNDKHPQETYLLTLCNRQSNSTNIYKNVMSIKCLEPENIDGSEFGYMHDDNNIYFCICNTNDDWDVGNRNFTILNNNNLTCGILSSFDSLTDVGELSTTYTKVDFSCMTETFNEGNGNKIRLKDTDTGNYCYLMVKNGELKIENIGK